MFSHVSNAHSICVRLNERVCVCALMIVCCIGVVVCDFVFVRANVCVHCERVLRPPVPASVLTPRCPAKPIP